MKLNAIKCYRIKFSRKQNLLRGNYHILGENIKEVDTIKDMGVIIDKKLTTTPRIGYVKKSFKNVRICPKKL